MFSEKKREWQISSLKNKLIMFAIINNIDYICALSDTLHHEKSFITQLTANDDNFRRKYHIYTLPP